MVVVVIVVGVDVCWINVCPERPVWWQAVSWREEHIVM